MRESSGAGLTVLLLFILVVFGKDALGFVLVAIFTVISTIFWVIVSILAFLFGVH